MLVHDPEWAATAGRAPARPVPAASALACLAAEDPDGATASVFSITWEPVDIADVLAAARRYDLHHQGVDLPGQASWDYAADGDPGGGDTAGSRELSSQGDCPGDDDTEMAAGDPGGEALPLAAIAGHVMTPPGPGLAGWLACAEAPELDDAALVTSITGWRKLTSWAQARELAAIAELERRRRGSAEDVLSDAVPPAGECLREPVTEFAADEIALALNLTRTGAENWTDLAASLTSRLPSTHRALAAGQIDLQRARLIEQCTGSLSEDLARKVEEKVLKKAPSQTSGQLRAALQRAVITVDPAAAERRRQEAEKDARVELFGDQEGTASLGGRFLPAAQAAAAWARICAMARAMESAGAHGGADLLRAQVFVGLLLGTLPLIPPPDGGPGDVPPPGCGPGDVPPPGCGPGDVRPPGATCEPPPDDGSPVSWPPLPIPGQPPMPGCAPAWPDLAASAGKPGGERAGPLGGAATNAPAGEARAGPRPDDGPPANRERRPRPVGKALLTVPWLTLAGLADEPSALSRIGPVTAQVGRELAAAAARDPACAWRLVLVGRGGNVLAVTGVPRTWLGTLPNHPDAPDGQAGAAGVVARVTLTLPVAAVDSLGDRDRDRSGGRQSAARSCPPGLSAVLAAALRAGIRLARDFRMAQAALTGVCPHDREVRGYRVPSSLRALIEARDQACRFPTCRQPAPHCDQEHAIPYARGGRTCCCNLSAICRHHHRLKQQPDWVLTQHRPGVLQWRTPAKLSYQVSPEPYAA